MTGNRGEAESGPVRANGGPRPKMPAAVSLDPSAGSYWPSVVAVGTDQPDFATAGLKRLRQGVSTYVKPLQRCLVGILDRRRCHTTIPDP